MADEQEVQTENSEASAEESAPKKTEEPLAAEKKGSFGGGCGATILVLALIVGSAVLYLQWQETSEDLARVRRETQQVAMVLTVVAKQNLASAREYVEGRNFGHASDAIHRARGIFSNTKRLVPVDSALYESTQRLVELCNSALKETDNLSADAVRPLTDAIRSIDSLQMEQAQEKLSDIRRAALAENWKEAKRSLEEWASVFERANEVAGQEASTDLVDDMVRGIGKLQKNVNDQSADAVKEIDTKLQKLAMQYIDQADSKVQLARTAVESGDTESAKTAIQDALTLFERARANKPEGMEENELDDIIDALGAAQKAVNDAATGWQKKVDKILKQIVTR